MFTGACLSRLRIVLMALAQRLDSASLLHRAIKLRSLGGWKVGCGRLDHACISCFAEMYIASFIWSGGRDAMLDKMGLSCLEVSGRLVFDNNKEGNQSKDDK
jgi:hypothetical protein